jgi:hypothetical protein
MIGPALEPELEPVRRALLRLLSGLPVSAFLATNLLAGRGSPITHSGHGTHAAREPGTSSRELRLPARSPSRMRSDVPMVSGPPAGQKASKGLALRPPS